MFAVIKQLIPQFHAYADQDGRYNMGATWTDQAGLQDYHNVQVMYVRNSEALALAAMLDKLKEYETVGQTLDTTAQAA
jgi:hypothetical protein